MTERQILEILRKQYTVDIDSVKFLREGGCVSYIASGYGRRYLLKIVKEAFIDTAKQSVDIMAYLDGHDFPVPRVIPAADGRLIINVNENGSERICILFSFIEGREPQLGERMEETGSLVGRLHQLMSRYEGRLTVHEKAFFIDRYIDILRRKAYPEEKLARYIEYGDALWEEVRDLPRGYCHGDLHRGNLLLTPQGELYLLDFDTSCRAFPAYDNMVICDATDYFRFDLNGFDRAARVYGEFLKGYERHHAVTVAERDAFHALIAIRHYQLQATILEMNGLDCVGEAFIDRQLDWLMRWREQCAQRLQ